MTTEEIAERLRGLGPSAPLRGRATEPRSVFEDEVRPMLARFGTSCDLVEIYSGAKRCETLEIDGRRYIIFDHALLGCFELFDRLHDGGAPPSLVAAAFQRPFAEAARVVQRLDFYSFFIRRACEVAPTLRWGSRTQDGAFLRRCQTQFVLCHEAAHALPPTHEMTRALKFNATLSVSSLTNELIDRINGRLVELVEGSPLSAVARADVDRWLAIRDDLNIGEDVIADTFYAVGTDARFLEEVASDAFAVTCAVSTLAALKAETSSDLFAESMPGFLLAAYRGFLHLRLLRYLDDVFRQLPVPFISAQLDPLKLRLMVEVLLRGNIVVLQLLAAAADFGSGAQVDALRHDIARVQASHNGRIFAVADGLMNMTLLSEDFHSKLGGLLAEDGVDSSVVDDDPFALSDEADALWRQLAVEDGADAE